MWHRHSAFLRSYRWLPHACINRAAAIVTRAQRPAWLVDRAVRAWIRAESIDLSDFVPQRYTSLEDFFLRELLQEARPLGSGIVSPADGRLLACGGIDETTMLEVKEQRLSLDRLVNGTRHSLDMNGYIGGSYATIFLTPAGYHRVHMPTGGELVACQHIPGRYFPQNEDALRHIERIYERNERAALHFQSDAGSPFLAVMIGASLIGGIHIAGLARSAWVRSQPFPVHRRLARGDELGHFTFGSTVVLLLPPGLAGACVVTPGDDIRMGETIWADEKRRGSTC
jgi:phosphatidylserine decarboxylase